MAERDFQSKLLKNLRSRYPDEFIYNCSDRYTSGIPDILMCLNGILVALELKWQDGRPSKLQLYNIRKIQRSGGYACVLRQKQGKFKIEHDDERFKTRWFDDLDELIEEVVWRTYIISQRCSFSYLQPQFSGELNEAKRESLEHWKASVKKSS